ncbi:MAG: heat-inducible transcriptional repressor HrcA [Acidimicrobiia bacterium]|nr:heat-inducible transcriptional repressor HrcA [Acidimicrobiia bacterium]
MIDDRKARVLEALVEEYIATGEPVSSRAVLDRSGLSVSSATVRNDLASLESYGFVSQPHTSAGRVPTDTGYRYYVDHCSPARLRAATRSRISGFFSSVHSQLGRLLQETSGLLADLTHYPAVVLGPGLVGESIRGIHLVPLGERVLLVVVVTNTGRVSQELVQLPAALADSDLEKVEAILDKAYCGHTFSETGEVMDAISADRAAPSIRSAISEIVKNLQRAEQSTREVYLGGTSQATSLWEDLAAVRRMLSLLEHEAVVMELIGAEEEGTTVRIGTELDAAEEGDLAVVASSYDAGEHGSGRVGVLGPMRMDYRRTIKVVEEIGESLGDRLGG